MTWFIFIGDLVVMAGLIAAAAWVFLRANPADIADAARIPLDDDGAPNNGDGDAPPRHPRSPLHRHPRSLLSGGKQPPPSRPQSVKRARPDGDGDA